MANTLRIKRRLSGSIGAPASLYNAELAYNELENILYYGKGSGGGGLATSIQAICGEGTSDPFSGFVTKGTTQSIGGDKTFAGTVVFSSATIPTVTGTISGADNSTKIATTAWVKAQGYAAGSLNLTFIGDVTGSGTTGSNVTLTIADVNDEAVNGATKVNYNSKGQIIASSSLLASDIPTLTASKISDFNAAVQANPLSSLAVPAANISLNNFKITSLGAPTAADDAATKAYVDALSQGFDVHTACRLATTANITLSGAQTIDGVSAIAGDRILVKDQTTQTQNGIYVVAAGAWTRATDADETGEIKSGTFVFINEGTVNASSGWSQTTTGTVTIGSSNIVFEKISSAGQITAGAGLTKTGSSIDVSSASAARIVVNADSIDLATTGVGAGTYKSVTTDVYGRITGGTNPTTLAGFGITDGQPLDATLTALAGVTTAADRLIYATGADAFTVTPFTAFARALLDDADATTMRTTLGLGSMALQATNSVTITGGSITNLTTFDGISIDGGTF